MRALYQISKIETASASYPFDFNPWLQSIGSTYSSATVGDAVGITETFTITNAVVNVVVAGGEAGQVYRIPVTCTAANGLTRSSVLEVSVLGVADALDPSGSTNVQDSLTGSSATYAPSVRAVNEWHANHLAAADPHPGYLTPAEGNAAYDAINAASASMTAHLAAGDPHPTYMTQAESDARYALQGSGGVGITDHGLLSGLADDDHPQYYDQTRGDARYSQLGHSHSYEAAGAVAAHVAAADPHTQYLTSAEGNAAYETVGALAGHLAAADPHTQYLRQSEADVLYEVSGAVAAHAGTGGTAHADVVAGGAAGFMTGAQATKLAGIATAATANDTDANLKARANHTGTQAGSTITGAVTALGVTMATARILGRGTAATGAIEELSIGSNLALNAGVLSATGVSGGTVTLAGTSLTLNAANKATYEGVLIECTSSSGVTITVHDGFHPALVSIKQAGAGVVTVVTSGTASITGDAATTVANGAFLSLLPSATAGAWTVIADGEPARIFSKVDGGSITRKHQLRGKYTTLAHPDTTKFPFRQVLGNGTTYTAADIDAGASLAGILERVDDSSFLGDGSSQAPAANRFSWKLIVDPTHVVTVGRPRTQILMETMTVGRKYRLEGWFRFHHPGGAGWCDLTAGYPKAGFLNMTQTTGGEYGANQDGGGINGPFTISIDGSKLFCAVRTIDAEQGSDDQGGYFNWGDGDTWDGRYRRSRPFVPVGTGYNHVSIETFLDHRHKRDGGLGYIKVRFNGETYLDYEGASIYGVAANTLAITQPHFRAGFYEVSGANLAGGTLCSTVSSCTIQRAIFWNGLNLQEVT